MYVFVAESPQNTWYIGAKHIKMNIKKPLGFRFKRFFICNKLLNFLSLTEDFRIGSIAVKIV